jgi:patatin-like phospholipase/acyl hydrolase
MPSKASKRRMQHAKCKSISNSCTVATSQAVKWYHLRPSCRILNYKSIVCVTRLSNSQPDLLRNYVAVHPTQENYECAIWEAASATTAAPLYFKPVVFSKTGEMFRYGGIRRNNPVNEAINETNRLKETERMKASTTDYLRKYQSGNVIKACAKSLLDPDANC